MQSEGLATQYFQHEYASNLIESFCELQQKFYGLSALFSSKPYELLHNCARACLRGPGLSLGGRIGSCKDDQRSVPLFSIQELQ